MGSGAIDRNSPRLKMCPVQGIWPGSDVAWDAHMRYQSAWDTVPALAPNSFLAIVHPGRGDRRGLGQLECPAPASGCSRPGHCGTPKMNQRTGDRSFFDVQIKKILKTPGIQDQPGLPLGPRGHSGHFLPSQDGPSPGPSFTLAATHGLHFRSRPSARPLAHTQALGPMCQQPTDT